jgi:glyoxylase I family protein
MAEKSRINTIGIHHVSINVTDVEAALAFYLNILELEQLPRPDLGFPGAWIKAGDQEIHLLGIDSGRPLKEQHFAFAVTDADSVHAAFNCRGFRTPRQFETFPTFVDSFLPTTPVAT